jgi:hypothetical protein
MSSSQLDAAAHGAVAMRDNGRFEICYNPLDTSRNEIRILVYRVAPCDQPPGIKVECIFKVVSLDDRPMFDALSYTWGPPVVGDDWKPGSQYVYFSGHHIPVTGNLFDALLAISCSSGIGRLVYIWADALCINQKDTSERSSQIALMASIYSRANIVRIWLGRSRNQEVETFFREAAGGQVPDLLTSNENEYLQGFNVVMIYSWWSRLWVYRKLDWRGMLLFIADLGQYPGTASLMRCGRYGNMTLNLD